MKNVNGSTAGSNRHETAIGASNALLAWADDGGENWYAERLLQNLTTAFHARNRKWPLGKIVTRALRATHWVFLRPGAKQWGDIYINLLQKVLRGHNISKSVRAEISTFVKDASVVMENQGTRRKPGELAQTQRRQRKRRRKEVAAPAKQDTGILDADSRLSCLAAKFFSPSVRVKAVVEATEEDVRLTDDEVKKVFVDLVPGVQEMIYRDQAGNYALPFMVGAYKSGVRAFNGTDVEATLRSAMRLIVHYARDGKPNAARYLGEVAEAFMDCQAVQGRTLERVAMLIRGVALDFKGHVVRLVDEYKNLAVKMHALKMATDFGGPDEWNDPAHVESRIIADLGENLFLNENLIQQAKLDEHANRFRRLVGAQAVEVIDNVRKLFDVGALVKALAAEVSTFNVETASDSLPSVFIKWVQENMTDKHIIFDQETCMSVIINDSIAVAAMEVVVFGKPRAPENETYRGIDIQKLFRETELAAEIARLELLEKAAEMRQTRLERLTRRLVSKAVTVQVPQEPAMEEARLDDKDVKQVFLDHVPGVEKYKYRQQTHTPSMQFLLRAYRDGFQIFDGTPLEGHLRSCMRFIVHYGCDGKPNAAKYLREVAEAFMDCQAVQARTVEMVALQLRGCTLDFRGHLVQLTETYKVMAIKTLAFEECTKLGGPDSFNDPPHYESRLLADIGERIGMNDGMIAQAQLDEHADRRFQKLRGSRRRAAVERIRALFDIGAFLKAFAAETGDFGEATAKDSLGRTFIDWASEHMVHKHMIFDEETCSRVVVEDELALAVMEVVFFRSYLGHGSEKFRDESFSSLFRASDEPVDLDHVDDPYSADESLPPKGKGKGKGHGFGMSHFKAMFMQDNDDDDEDEEESDADKDNSESSDREENAVEVECDVGWLRLEQKVEKQIAEARRDGKTTVACRMRGYPYIIDLEKMTQVNKATGKSRSIRFCGKSDS